MRTKYLFYFFIFIGIYLHWSGVAQAKSVKKISPKPAQPTSPPLLPLQSSKQKPENRELDLSSNNNRNIESKQASLDSSNLVNKEEPEKTVQVKRPFTSVSIYADVGGGFLAFPQIYQSLSPQGMKYMWSHQYNSFQPVGLTRIGARLGLFPGFDENPNDLRSMNVHLYFEVGSGYINQQTSPFLQMMVGASVDLTIGQPRTLSIGMPKVMLGYAYVPSPFVLVHNQENAGNGYTAQPPTSFLASSMSIPFTLFLDRFVHQPGWQIYAEPQFVWYLNDKYTDGMIGFMASLGFRHLF